MNSRPLLIAALLTTSLSATAETYICNVERDIPSAFSKINKWTVVSGTIYGPNIVFEKNAEGGAFKQISGKRLSTCNIEESKNGEHTYCSSLNISFVLHNVKKHFIMYQVDIDRSDTLTEYGTCELFNRTKD